MSRKTKNSRSSQSEDPGKPWQAVGKRHRVRVATSDNAESLIILGHGALRLSARQLHEEVEQTMGQIADILQRHANTGKSDAMRQALNRAGKARRE